MGIDEILESLPDTLGERTRRIGRENQGVSGEFVLYWMRTAIRIEENPALNVAVELANRTELPLLVYQGLSEKFPYTSDRHHTFVLQGAKDVQAAFARQGIQYALHVERNQDRGPHLQSLASRAAVIVTEDMPTKPLRTLTVRLGQVHRRPVLAVDTACVVPMQLVEKPYTRAFEFRNATKQLFAERLQRPPEAPQLNDSLFISCELPFNSIDLQNHEIASVVADCKIDHSIGPVPHTVGGSVAGYRRWQRFKTEGLPTYHQRRNDPLLDGASRLSPYLHYGMIAPTRIAREAAEEGSEGAEKFLDELLIWRELAYVFCHHRHDHWRISALPKWARETLAEHESDPRPANLSWETMARGKTGDRLWDAAQRSLLIHGELHNNVRMTWGKAILNWTPNAKLALANITDLNHRFALDGYDPASYGGILWCLGQFDRPFSPSQPIFGRVRGRSTDQHARRLDPQAYLRHTTRPLWGERPKIGVIGAGLSGLACARTLHDHGAEVIVFEKSRGVGGRMSTRRSDGKPGFDHGAQYFTVRDRRFRRFVQSWRRDGLVEPWRGKIVAIEGDQITETKSGTERLVAVPGMNAIAKHLAVDVDVRLQTHVDRLHRTERSWSIECQDGQRQDGFDAIVVALPSHQATPLLSPSQELSSAAAKIKMNGCWTLMLSVEHSLGLEFDGAFVNQSPLSWIAKNSSKPRRDDQTETWVIHASHEWTEAHLEDSADDVQRFLIETFTEATGAELCKPIDATVHRWRYAMPAQPYPDECLFDTMQMIGSCGDWCGGPRVEGAFLSGMAVAGRILSQLKAEPGQKQHLLPLGID